MAVDEAVTVGVVRAPVPAGVVGGEVVVSVLSHSHVTAAELSVGHAILSSEENIHVSYHDDIYQ